MSESDEETTLGVVQLPTEDELIVLNDDGTTTVTLEDPLRRQVRRGKELEDEIIDKLTFPAKLLVSHIEATDNSDGDVGKAVHMLAALVELPYSMVRRMEAGDFARASTVLNRISGNYQAIGGKL